VAATFCVYDGFVGKRNQIVVNAATRSNAIVSSLFPSQVRDRLFMEAHQKEAANDPKRLKLGEAAADKLKGVAGGYDDSAPLYSDRPIADLFPETSK
jgi:hypothetical protein